MRKTAASLGAAEEGRADAMRVYLHINLPGGWQIIMRPLLRLGFWNRGIWPPGATQERQMFRWWFLWPVEVRHFLPATFERANAIMDMAPKQEESKP